MAERNRSLQSTDDRTILLEQLKEHQENYNEGSYKWLEMQKKIDQLIAENYSSYMSGTPLTQ